MGNYVKLQKVIECKDPTRRSSWSVRMHLPIDQEQFEIIDCIIRSLRNILDSYLVVELADPLQKMTYLQICRDNEDLWRIELHFEQPDIFPFKVNGKTYIRKHPWTQKLLYVYNVEEAISIFRDILCNRCIPDLGCWRNYTKHIHLSKKRNK